MPKRTQLSIALTIGGSDSGGGAGIQADLKTFATLGVHGTSVITCLTAQNPTGVLGLQPATPDLVRQQLEAVFAELRPTAGKTGLLYSAAIVRTLVQFFKRGRPMPLIVDPVMAATSGARLLQSSALRALCDELLPLATLVTPNLNEAERLLGTKIEDTEGQRAAARQLVRRYGCAALVKGGHLKGATAATDIFNDGRTELRLTAPFLRGIPTHGTGCAFSAAIAAGCARGEGLTRAVRHAKDFITQAIARSQRIRRHYTLNWQPASYGGK